MQDRASTDESPEILRGLAPWIDSLTIERDGGSCDAMNRALMRATGDHLLFLNAHGFFDSNDVRAAVADMIDGGADDIVHGLWIVEVTGRGHEYRPASPFRAGSTFDHQVAYIRRELLQQLQSDTSCRNMGNPHFATRARKRDAKVRHSDLTIAREPFFLRGLGGS